MRRLGCRRRAATAGAIGDAGGQAVAIGADVSNEDSVIDVVREGGRLVRRRRRGVRKRGINATGRIADLELETWNRVIAVNLTGVFLTDEHAVRQMVAQGTGGSIINQSSVAALRGTHANGAYAAAKGGVLAMTRQIALDYGADGVRVNVVCPGTVPTPLVDKTYEERAEIFGIDIEVTRAQTLARHPLGRLGDPRDIANIALFLASDDAEWVTGSVFVADGGFTST